MSFTESNTVEQMILNAATGLDGKGMVIRKDAAPYSSESLGDALRPARWTYASYDWVPRQLTCPRIVHGQCSTGDRE